MLLTVWYFFFPCCFILNTTIRNSKCHCVQQELQVLSHCLATSCDPSVPHRLNTLRQRQNGRHFADDIFKRIFLNGKIWISINISLRFVPRGPMDNIPALVQIMAWRRPGDKPLSGPMMVSLLTHICDTRPQWVKRCTALDWWNKLQTCFISSWKPQMWWNSRRNRLHFALEHALALRCTRNDRSLVTTSTWLIV